MSIQAGEIGALLVVDAKKDLGDASDIYLLVKQYCESFARSLQMEVVVGSENFASRLTEEDDFPVAGNYSVQLFAEFPNGEGVKVLKSPVVVINIGEALELALE